MPDVVARGAGRQAGRPPGQARGDPAADVRGHRLPHADDPAGAARRRRRRPARPRSCTTSSSRAPRSRVRRADRGGHPDDVRRAAPAHHPPAGAARRPDAVLDARARRGAGHVRAGVGDGRAGRSPAASTRSSCGSATSRPPTRRAACRSARATWSPACARARGGSAGPTATPRRRCGATGGGWSAPGWRPPPTRPTARPRTATARAEPDGRFAVRIAAADIGTGARTVLTQIAADALGVAARARPGGDRRQRAARRPSVAGGSMGTASWGSAVVEACAGAAASRRTAARCPPAGSRSRADTERGRRGRRAVRPARLRRAVRRGRAWTRDTGRSGCRGCSACSPRGGSSTRRPRARSSSAA